MTNIIEVIELSELNHKLLDLNHSLLSRIISLYKKNHIPLETDQLEILLANIGNTLQKFDQPKVDSQKNNRRFDRT